MRIRFSLLNLVLLATLCIAFILHRNSSSSIRIDYAPLIFRGEEDGFTLNDCTEPYAISKCLSREHKTLQVLKKCYLKPPSGVSYNQKTVDQAGGDIGIFIEETFNDTRHGFFIEAGARNGVAGSLTVWLEQNLKWTGLLIEPNKHSCIDLLTKRRDAWISCTCISPSAKTEQLILEVPTNEGGHSTSLQLANSRLSNSVFRTINDIINKTSVFTQEKVQCFPLVSYLVALRVSRVDFLSLDTQGFEDEMLATFPFEAIQIRYMIVKHFNTNKGALPRSYDENFVKFVTNLGFTLIKNTEWNYIFQNIEEKSF